MTVHKGPPPEAKKEEHELSATWAVVKKRKDDADHLAFPRLSIRSTEEIYIACGIDLTQCYHTTMLDLDRGGVWLGLVDAKLAQRSRGVATKFAFWKNQTRVNFYSLVGSYKGMGTEFHDVKVEVWRNFGSEDAIVSWLFAEIKHAEVLQRFKGSSLFH